MIKVNICGTEKEYDSSIASWINEQYHNRRKAGVDFWFIVTIKYGDINLRFPSAGAPCGNGVPYYNFNPREQQIIDIWNEMGVKQDENISILLRFLRQLKGVVD
jgi:hypothetical protein